MARKLFSVVGVLSLVLVGSRGMAQANEPDDVYEVLGVTFCGADVPAERTCDWRPPEAARERPQSESRDGTFNLFGWMICFGDPSPSAACDVKIPALSRDYRARL